MSSNNFDVLSILQDAEGTTPKEPLKEPPKESSEGTPKEPSKGTPKEIPKETSEEPPKKNKSGKTPKYIENLKVAVSESELNNHVNELIEQINQKITESGKKIPKIQVQEPKVYKYKDSIYTTLTEKQKKALRKGVNSIKSKVSDETELGQLANELYSKIDVYGTDSETVDGIKKDMGKGKIVIYKEVKPQMTVQNYIDELAQLDAFAIPEEKLRQGLINAIDNKIIGLDKNKIDSTIDSIYSKSLLFNKKLKKILEDTPEEELVEKIPPDVLKRLNKIRNEKQDTKNRKYKLFRKPPNEFHTESPATIPPHERDYQPPYGLNPLLLRGARILTNQFI